MSGQFLNRRISTEARKWFPLCGCREALELRIWREWVRGNARSGGLPDRAMDLDQRGIIAAAKRFWYWQYRRWIRIGCSFADCIDRFRPAPQDLPVPPALLRFRVAERIGRDSFVTVGRAAAENLITALAVAGRTLRPSDTVLDFGCGCGRTLVWLPARFPEARFFGTDTDRDAIAWCQRNLPNGAFVVNDSVPPMPFRDGSFDLVSSVSVFTHLNEEHQLLWLAELRRVLKPGGLAILTIHGEDAANVLGESYAARLRECGFLHCTSPKLKGIVPAWYHTTFMSEDYVIGTWTRFFAEVRIVPRLMGIQDVVIATA